MRSVKYISLTLLALFLLILGGLYAVFYSSPFQNWLTGKLTAYLSAQFKTKISIGHINYLPLHTFELENVLFGDTRNDTLFFAGSLRFNLAGLNIDSGSFQLSNVKVDRGYCRLVFYQDGSYNLSVLDNISDPNDTSVSAIPFKLTFNKVTCTNSRFRFINETDTGKWEGFAPNDEDFYDVDVSAHDFRIINDSLHFVVDRMKLKEKSGFVAENLSTVATISPTCMLYEALSLKTPYSEIRGDYGMRYESWGSFGDYYNQVKQEARLSTSVVSLQDVAFFAPAFKAFRYTFVMKGEGSGNIANMRLRNLDIRFGRTGLFRGEAKLNGLPDISNTFIEARVTEARATRNDMEYLAGEQLPEEIGRLGTVLFKGRYTGFYTDFVAYGHFTTALGTAETDLNMKIAGNLADCRYSGQLKLHGFDLATLSGSRLLGPVTATAGIDGTGLSFNGMTAKVRAEVPAFTFNGYRYSNIAVDGRLEKKMINARLLVKDPNADLDFDGIIDLSGETPEYRFKAKLAHAHLKPLGFDTADIMVSAGSDIDFNWKDLDHNNGTVKISDIEVVKGDELYAIREFFFRSSQFRDDRTIRIRSDHFSGTIAGRFTFADIPDAVMTTLSGLAPRYIDRRDYRHGSMQDFTFDLSVQTLYPFNELFFKHIELKDAVAKGEFNTQNNRLLVSGYIEELTYNKLRLEKITLRQNQTGEQDADFIAGVQQVFVNDTVLTKNAALKISLTDNVADLHLLVKDTLSMFSSDIRARAHFIADTVRLVFDNSRVSYVKSRFRIRKDGEIVYHPGGIRFNNLLISRNKDESILLDGLYGLASKPHDLRMNVSNFRLNVLNEWLPYLGIGVNGLVNGSMNLTGTGEFILSSDASVNDLALDNDTIGDFRASTSYIAQQRRLMAVVKSGNGKLRNVEFSGYYDFTNPSDALNFHISFDESDITSFQAFVKGYLTLYSGSVRVKGMLSGSLKQPELQCDMDLMGITLAVDYLKTMYSFSTRVNINEQQITIAPTEIRDINDHKARLSGYVLHRSFSNFRLNVKLDNMNDFQVLNTRARDNDLFYGTAYTDGNISLSGPVGDLVMEASLTGQRGSVINIPVSDGYTDGYDGLLNYVSRDTIVKTRELAKSGSISGFTINCMMHVTRDVEINIVFDEQLGDKIRGRGNGDLKLELTKNGHFNMYGEVEIDEGEYRFTAMNLFTKKFTLRKGGTITWAGDPLQGQMNITGVYSLRTSVSDLVATSDKDAIGNQRIPVECLLYLRGNLLKADHSDIRFDINIYDLNGSLSNSAVSEVQNLLRVWRNDNELMTQQVISLMLFGRFSPTNVHSQPGTASLTAGVNNTLSGFVSAQATSFIQQIIPGLDLNVDYHTGNESERSRTILSASRRFFDGRLEVQANYDPINTYQNFSTQYNLTRDGNLKLKGFSRAQNDQLFNSNINTQGMGLYYRKEFDKFSDLFTRKTPVNNLSQ